MAIGVMGSALASGGRPQEIRFGSVDFLLSTERDYLWFLGVTAALFLFKSVLSTTFLRLTSFFLAKEEGLLARELAEFLFSGNLDRLKRFSRGDLHFVLTSSVQHASTSLLAAGSSAMAEGTLFLAVSIAFVYVDSTTAMVVAVYFVALIALFQLAVNKQLAKLGKSLADTSVFLADIIQDFALAFREITVLSKTPYFVERFSSARRGYARDIATQSFLFGLPRFFVEVGLMLGFVVLVIWQSAQGDLINGLVTTAVFLAGGLRMMAGLLPLQNALAAIRTLGPQASIAQNVLTEARQVEKTPDPQDHDSPEKKLATPFAGGFSIKADGVSFTHKDGENLALSDVSLAILENSFAAIVGPSGAGKSTLVDILLGLYRPDHGAVSISGHDPVQIRSSMQGSISYVPQSPGLVSGTVVDNVALGVEPAEVDHEAVLEALRRVELEDFVKQLPKGIFSDLGKQADSLSGGQRQRLGLARALYQAPRLLVLDEATSALDPGTEAEIGETLRSLRNDTTIVVIAHRLSTVQSADQVFVVENGKIVCTGSFPEVLQKSELIKDYVRLMTID